MSNKYSFVIKVKEDYKEGGHYILTSQNLPGFFMGGTNIEKLRNDIPNTIKLIFELNYGIDVDVRPLVDPKPNLLKSATKGTRSEFNHPAEWSACPAHA